MLNWELIDCLFTWADDYLSQVIEGYEMACRKTLEILPDCVCSSAKDLHDLEEATAMIRSAVMSKQYGNEDFLAKLIAQACGKTWILWSNREKFISNVRKFLWKFCDNLRGHFNLLLFYSLYIPWVWQFQCR